MCVRSLNDRCYCIRQSSIYRYIEEYTLLLLYIITDISESKEKKTNTAERNLTRPHKSYPQTNTDRCTFSLYIMWMLMSIILHIHCHLQWKTSTASVSIQAYMYACICMHHCILYWMCMHCISVVCTEVILRPRHP